MKRRHRGSVPRCLPLLWGVLLGLGGILLLLCLIPYCKGLK